jgi:hypothetical protein
MTRSWMGERTKHVEQQLAGRLGGVHAFRQRTERDLLFLERVDDGQQMGERSPEAIQLPDNQDIASLHKVQRFGQTGTVILGPRGVIRE